MTDKEIAVRRELNAALKMFESTMDHIQHETPSHFDLIGLRNILHTHISILRDMLPKHGTTSEFQKGCRCEQCRKAKADYNKMYKKVKGKKK